MWHHVIDALFSVIVAIVAQSLSHIQLLVTQWAAVRQAPPPFTISLSSLKLTSIESGMPPNHLTLCHPLVLLPQSSPESGTFPTSQFFSSGGQSIGVSASVFPTNIQGWFPLGLTGFQLLNIIFRFSSLSGRAMLWVWSSEFNQELTNITRMYNGHMCQSSTPRSSSGSAGESWNLQ